MILTFKWNFRLNETGTYQYWESNASKEVPDLVMSGTITVISNNQHNVTTGVHQKSNEIVGTYMIPARFLDKYRDNFRIKNLL